MRPRHALVLLLALSASAPLAAARPASLVGKWRLDLAQSELLPGEEKPAALVMTITRDSPSSFAWTVTVRMKGGATGTVGFKGAIDGKPYPVSGRPGSTSAFSWTADGRLKQVSQGPGGIAVETCTVSRDALRMSCEAKQTAIDGRVFAYTETYERD